MGKLEAKIYIQGSNKQKRKGRRKMKSQGKRKKRRSSRSSSKRNKPNVGIILFRPKSPFQIWVPKNMTTGIPKSIMVPMPIKSPGSRPSLGFNSNSHCGY